MKNKVDVIKIISTAGMVLGMVGTLLSNYAGEKNMEKTVSEKVNEALKNHK